MPFVFAYGTLQQQSVQLSTFGRLLDGHCDELVGYERSLVKIDNAEFVAASGQAHHATVIFTGNQDSRVSGTKFEVTDAELAAADEYERAAAYIRVPVTLASGTQAWAFVHTEKC